jgi:hypothetical protein
MAFLPIRMYTIFLISSEGGPGLNPASPDPDGRSAGPPTAVGGSNSAVATVVVLACGCRQ